jgi:uncharacterized membrane protein (UPF0182 family)
MRGLGILVIFVIAIVVLFFRQAIGLYTDWLWFQEVGYTQVFSTTLLYKTILGFLAGGLFAAIVYINLKIAAATPASVRFSSADNVIELPPLELIDPVVKRLLLPGALLIGLMAAPQGAAHWQQFALFLNPVDFNIQDPQFLRDIGFYIFRLPALRIAYHWLIFALALSLIATAAIYLLYRAIEYSQRGLFLADRAKTHLLILAAGLLLAKAVGYYLDAFDLLYSTRSAGFGAGYADIHAVLPALRVLAVIALLASAICVTQIYRDGFRLLVLGLGGLVVAHAIGLNGYPALLQRFRVAPNEIVAERPFIERSIKFTRLAFGLDKIESQEFPAEETLTAEDLKRNQSTIDNIRLWDHRPLLVTYSQLQEIRPYYKFVDVDNDRYVIVADHAAPASYRSLQSRWINERRDLRTARESLIR